MASTKQKQAEARARRNADKSQFRIDEQKFTDTLVQLAHIIMKHEPNQDYRQTANMSEVANAIIDNKQLNATDLQQLLIYRNSVDRTLKSQYGCALPNDLTAIAIDPEELLKRHNVPQHVRVVVGLLDLIIARLAIRAGAIKFSIIK